MCSAPPCHILPPIRYPLDNTPGSSLYHNHLFFAYLDVDNYPLPVLIIFLTGQFHEILVRRQLYVPQLSIFCFSTKDYVCSFADSEVTMISHQYKFADV
jgi:hypothetical protein